MVLGFIFHNLKTLLQLLEGKVMGNKGCRSEGLLF